MSKKKRRGSDADEYSRDAYLTNPPASANDFTGMVPAEPESVSEAKNYSGLMGVPISGEGKRRSKRK